jgi:uroporphyrinogen decarboxylase
LLQGTSIGHKELAGSEVIFCRKGESKIAQFKQDRMTEKERFQALLNRQPVDRVPFFMWALSFAAVNCGYPKIVTYAEPDKSFELLRRTHEMFDGWHWTYYTAGALGVREFGSTAKLPTDEYSQSVSLLEPVVKSEEDVDKLELPDVKTAGQLPLVKEHAKLQEKHGWPITFSSGSILGRVQAITGVEKMCRWMMKKPELIHRICRLAADFHIAIAEHWVDSFGCPERMIPLTAAPTESNQIISPKFFEEFSVPYQREVHERILELGVKHIHVHVCGEQNLNLPYWKEVPIGDPGILSFGHEVDLDKAAEYFPDDIIVGNVEPAVIHTGKPEKIYKLSRICIEKGKKHPGGYAFSPGCELPPLSPPYNVWTMRKAINDFGWYD